MKLIINTPIDDGSREFQKARYQDPWDKTIFMKTHIKMLFIWIFLVKLPF